MVKTGDRKKLTSNVQFKYHSKHIQELIELKACNLFFDGN
jgi:hypothetical protein